MHATVHAPLKSHALRATLKQFAAARMFAPR